MTTQLKYTSAFNTVQDAFTAVGKANAKHRVRKLPPEDKAIARQNALAARAKELKDAALNKLNAQSARLKALLIDPTIAS